jgi:hypothetical protein
MRCAPTAARLFTLVLGVLLAAPLALAQWDQAELETITSGPPYDALGRNSVAIDDAGTLHAVYRRGVGAEHGLYYVSKPQGGTWSAPETVGAPGTYPGWGWMDVRRGTGEPYVLFFDVGSLSLGIRRTGGWEFHVLEIPAEYGVGKVAMAVDDLGYAHVALQLDLDDPQIWQMGYGYWDGSPDFHFQRFEWSLLPEHGLFSQPDIAVKGDGSVAVAFQQDYRGQILVRVMENAYLGGTGWTTENIDVPGVILYSESIVSTPRGDLHLAFHVNIELGAENRVYYANRKGKKWGTPFEIGGAYTGARPRMALGTKDEPHIVFEETLGPHSTGRIVHVTKNHGKWRQNVVQDGEAFNPTLVMDVEGNGTILFERKIVHMEDNDIECFGYVAPPR